jgi:hypothetical protein
MDLKWREFKAFALLAMAQRDLILCGTETRLQTPNAIESAALQRRGDTCPIQEMGRCVLEARS